MPDLEVSLRSRPTPETVSGVMESLPRRMQAERLVGWSSCLHFRLQGADEGEWTVRVHEGRCAVERGAPATADCTVEMKAKTLLGIAAGKVNPQAAFMMGRIKVTNIAAMLRFIKALRLRERGSGPGDQEGGKRAASTAERQGPLAGTVVVDVSRMLPGAVLARMLLDLGARLIKVEDPGGGDPLRGTLPLVDGEGVGFRTFFRGCESVALDLQEKDGAGALRHLARHADVLVESFSAGILESWGLGVGRLHEINPALVVCSLSGFSRETSWSQRPGHDINFVALSGLMASLGEDALPRLQFADVAGGLLAASAILAGLLQRQGSGRGCHIEQPLAAATVPFMAWAWAEAMAGGGGTSETLLTGRCPAYRRYRCRDGKSIAVGALEPKFWERMVSALGAPHLAGVGLDTGPGGAAAAAEVEELLGRRSRDEWIALLSSAGVPASPVNNLAEAVEADYFVESRAVISVPDSRGKQHNFVGSFVPSFGSPAASSVPKLGENTRDIMREFGVVS